MPTGDSHEVDLDAYFARIEYTGHRRPSLATLKAIHLAHATHIPFENIDVRLGQPIRLDVASLEAKLVGAKRGGYCFEQNTLLAAVLEQLGFDVTRLAARVRLGAQRVLPRTHMTLEVDVHGHPWLADVGFGGGGLLEPLPLAERETRQFAWEYRLIQEHGTWVLAERRHRQWLDFYAFTREPQLPIDFEVANHYVATHPESRFLHTLTVQLPMPTIRYSLNNRTLTTTRATGETTRPLENDEALLKLLADRFGLSVPAGPWLPAAEAMTTPEMIREVTDATIAEEATDASVSDV